MDITYIITVFGVILVSMTLHEAMHAYVGYWLGDDTAKLGGRLTLNPLKHIDPILTIALPLFLAAIGAPIFGGAKPVPFNPSMLRYEEWGAAMVAAAGPLTNLLIAFILFGFYVIFGVSGDTGIGQVLIVGVFVNLGFFIFNSIPIPPLDGSRVLYALAPDFFRRGMEFVERFGIIFIFVIVLVASDLIGRIMQQGMKFFIGVFTAFFSWI